MVGRPRNSFTCRNCQALYEIVKVEAGPETDSCEIVCRTCGAPLVGREGMSVLKYFLLRKGLRSRRQVGTFSKATHLPDLRQPQAKWPDGFVRLRNGPGFVLPLPRYPLAVLPVGFISAHG
jgi:hypothetical protein